LAWPAIIKNFFYPIYLISSVIVCGNLGSQQLAGFTIGSLTTSIFAITTGFSFATCLSTEVAPLFTNKQYRECRVCLHKQFYLNTVVFGAICVPLLFISPIYALLGIDAEVSSKACQYVWVTLPGVYLYIQSESCIAYANSMKKTELGMTVVIASTLF
jgi:Na+-driven multidrug efflux pump